MPNRFTNQNQVNFFTRSCVPYFKFRHIFSWLLKVRERTLLILIFQISMLFSTNLGN